MRLFRHILSIALLLHSASAQLPPTPEGLTTVQSRFGNGVSISYKQFDLCETTPGVKSYSGYVHLPPGTLSDVDEYQNYSINTFFIFFESRKDSANAPLSIWMNGGPGSSSMIGLWQENGPCNVNDDSNSTTLNPWSWNNEVNMLYIDQPVQTGFSYDALTNGTLDTTTGVITPTDFSSGIPEQNNTFYVGTFPSQSTANTANDTANAAKAMWHFAQIWFQEFPDYKPNDDSISIFTESYGGRYGPAFSAYFEEQNMRISNGSFNHTGETFYIHLDTLGIINGCIDVLTQALSFPTFAYNNTYGIQAINESLYLQAIDDFYTPGGCRDQILTCQNLAAEYDPDFTGNNNTVNQACVAASNCENNLIEGAYGNYSGLNYYDIGAPSADPFPPQYYVGYLAEAYVQQALGVPINFTESTNGVYYAFNNVGDYARTDIRGGYLQDLAYLLNNGVKVALMYGDRDFACEWLGGEEVSLAVNYSNTVQFHAAGYQDIQVNSSYVGGQVRQYGNFSFSRVYQSGHEIPAYQPETAYQLFHRAIFSLDMATGSVSTAANSNYSTTGSSTTFQVQQAAPPQPEPTCYILSLEATCTTDQQNSVIDGTALIHDYIVIDNNTAGLFPGFNTTSGNATNGTGGAMGTGGDGPRVNGSSNVTSTGSPSGVGGSAFTGDARRMKLGWSCGLVLGGVGLLMAL